jgi:predicted dehydrogenase
MGEVIIMAVQTRREFMATSSLGTAGLPLLAAREPSPTSSRKYRACVIGHTGRGDYGHMGDGFSMFPNITVTAVADPEEKGRLLWARRLKAPQSYADYRKMLQKEKPDLVAICPNGYSDQRLEMVRAAAEVGAHLLVEKPHARSPEEADEMIALVEKHKLKSVVYMPRPASGGVMHLKKLVDGGLIGDLVEVQVRGIENLLHMGWHSISLMRYFAGEPLWCSARVTQGKREITVKDARPERLGLAAGDSIHASYAFPGKLQGHFVWQVRGNDDQVTLYGSKGIAHFFAHTENPTVYHVADPEWTPGKTKAGVTWQPLVPPKEVETGSRANVKRLVVELLRAIETGGQARASLYEARGILEMLLACYTSQLTGGRVSFPLKERKHPLGALKR